MPSTFPTTLIHLPNEIWIAIFEFACEGGDPLHNRDSRRITNLIDRVTRHAIGSTCQLWRIVTLNSLSLWSRISVDTNNSGELFPPISFLELERKRAKENPLEICVQRYASQSRNFAHLPVVSFIQAHAARWRSLYFPDLMTSAALLYTLYRTQTSPVKFPQLRKLVVGVIFSGQPSTELPNHLDLTGSPYLHHLSLGSFDHPTRLPPSNNLSKLELNNSSPFINDIHLLQNCPNLTELEWKKSSLEVTPFEMDEIYKINLPHLHHLSFLLTSRTDAPVTVLERLSAPSLRKLSIYDGMSLPFNHFPILDAIDIESDSLSLNMRYTNTCDVLRNAPTVSCLTLTPFADPTTTVWGELLKRDGQGSFELLPDLCSLIIPVKKHLFAIAEEVLEARNAGETEHSRVNFKLYPLAHGLWGDPEYQAFCNRHPHSVYGYGGRKH